MSLVFLLGAGASIPAGLFDINQLTDDFEQKELKGEFKEAYFFVKDGLKSKYEKVDMEHILQQLNEFVVGPRETSTLFSKNLTNVAKSI